MFRARNNMTRPGELFAGRAGPLGSRPRPFRRSGIHHLAFWKQSPNPVPASGEATPAAQFDR
ncbi:MAG: hypothetical protein N2C14_28975, partial [Planctomycetales bacterium]